MQSVWWLNQSQTQNCAILGQRSVHQSGFVLLMEFNPEGIISCTFDPLQAWDRSFPTSYHTPHLEFVCLFKRSRNRKHILLGPNPAKGRLRNDLDNQFNSKFCETLGHEKTLIDESNHGHKVVFWAEFDAFHPDRSEGMRGDHPGVFFSLAAWAAWSPILPACHTENTVLGSFGRFHTPWN